MLKERNAFFRVFSSVFYTVFLCVFFNIYLNLILIIIIITIIILWESFPARVVCCPAGVFPVGSRSLLKLSQVGSCWLAGKYWKRYWGFFFSENIGSPAVAILDNSYRKCYNKCNDDNKNVICHQTGKNAPVSRFCL